LLSTGGRLLSGANCGFAQFGHYGRMAGVSSKGWTRFLPLGLLLAGLAAFFALGLQHEVTLAALKAHRAALNAYVEAHPVEAAALFAAAYVGIVACSIPAGTPMTLAAGFLFGIWEGAALVVVSATVGATAIFLAAKTALAPFLAARGGATARKMEHGIRRNALFYVLFTRLVPVFPFFLVNIAAGLLGVATRTYVLATFLGIIPGTLVYAGLGSGLGKLFDEGAEPDLRLIFRPEILYPLLGLAALAILPVIWRSVRARRPA
jgi:uncharacterized membrane protein YdjX (TVP38/TMEM64 family)